MSLPSLPPFITENFERYYGTDSTYRPYAISATFFFILFMKRDSRRAGFFGIVATIAAYYVAGFIGNAFSEFAPPPPTTAATARR